MLLKIQRCYRGQAQRKGINDALDLALSIAFTPGFHRFGSKKPFRATERGIHFWHPLSYRLSQRFKDLGVAMDLSVALDLGVPRISV